MGDLTGRRGFSPEMHGLRASDHDCKKACGEKYQRTAQGGGDRIGTLRSFCAFFCPEVDFAGSFGTWERPVTVETVEIKHRLYLFIQELKLPIDRNNISIYEKLYLV